MSTLAPLGLMLRHEARLSWRQSSARMTSKATLACVIGFLVLMHLVAVPFGFVLWEMPALERIDVLAYVTAVGVSVLMMMIPVALIGTVQTIYARADMDLLLSSPVPAQAVILVRVLTTAFNMLCVAGVFILPFANVLALFGYPRFLIAYVVLLCLALTATVIGVLLAQGLFWLFGARRTRIFAQILGGVLGVGFLLLVNIHNILPASAQSAALQSWADLIALLPPADSWVWLPARAAIGEPLPFLVAVVLCGALFAMTTFGLADRLIANAIAANGTAGKTVKTRSSRALAPRGGPIRTLRRKEWLLIIRDPWLISQLAMQLMVFVPTIFIAWKSGAAAAYVLGMALVYLTGHLAGMLAWLAVSTEEAPDLLATAPVRRADVTWAKVQAALIPTAILAAVPLAAAFHVDVWLGFTTLVCSTGNALSTSLLHVLRPSIGKRKDLAWRGSSDKMTSVVEMLLGVMWLIFGVLMLVFGWWGMLAFVVLLPFAYRIRRSHRA